MVIEGSSQFPFLLGASVSCQDNGAEWERCCCWVHTGPGLCPRFEDDQHQPQGLQSCCADLALWPLESFL